MYTIIDLHRNLINLHNTLVFVNKKYNTLIFEYPIHDMLHV
jgi:hypothetical protein